MNDVDKNIIDKPVAESGAEAEASGKNQGGAHGFGGLLLGLLALIFLAACIGVAVFWLRNRPKAERRKPPVRASLVTVKKITPRRHQVIVEAMGTVVPALEIDLAARVAGRIVEVSPAFAPGGRFRKGERILKIDEEDYQLVLRQRQSELARALSNLDLEMGRQEIAKSEFSLLDIEVQDQDRGLVLRKPQLKSAEAAVDNARARVDKAELDLRRTRVTAPFNAMVRQTKVDLGSEVRDGTALATLVGTDEYWIEATVPTDELKWLDIPGFNSTQEASVKVFYETAWGQEAFREGIVKRLLADLEPEGRMARLLISVTDPLQLTDKPDIRHPLILDSYVTVKIRGRRLPDTFAIPRDALHDGNQIWIMDNRKKLDIREVTRVWSTADTVYAMENVKPGDLLITSDLGAPVEGMALRTESEKPRAPAKKQPGQK
ncbi:MAG: efflux RND transporter periplasmic adaptor subunit [Lentisphaeria bacterium]